ncbi:flagellar motor protein MotB [Massilia sp. Root351]|jgi:outer membrane protein OmpA-like peptidoglycan-associated protein|uniref:OmpA family protein n=1 Tax=Massilia sp. Root351 TaxID=1736522 RepID=UPI000709A42A|nr:OmpA family protein [Massilia sp. Root351]KQV84928.1 flagellar motor protein MotB [Massilia sp. Root351]
MKMIFKPAALALAIALGACSSAPTTTSLLDQTRGDYMAAQNNPAVAQYAPVEFRQATAALDRANEAAARKDDAAEVDKLAYIAKQRIGVAQEVAKQKGAEAQVADAARQRDQIRLDARTAEAENAKRSAEQAQAQAEAARMAAETQAGATRDAQAKADALAAQLADLQAKQTERGIVITFGDVLFNTDQAVLTEGGQRTLRKLADVLTQNPDRSVMVEGFTDSTGSSAHNLELSQRRAEAVRSALMAMGIEGTRVATRGYGEAYPVAGNDSAGNRQLNRRVEIVLSDAGRPVNSRR